MCTLDQLTYLSQVASLARTNEGFLDTTLPFGELNDLIMGDLHQFPPVAALNAALYQKPPDHTSALVGKALYEQFDTVVRRKIENTGKLPYQVELAIGMQAIW